MRPRLCPGSSLSRRQWLTAAVAAVAVPRWVNASAPSAPVAVAKCADYGPALTPTMEKMMDQLGGLGRLVKGKTVAIKINMTGGPRDRMGFIPAEDAQYTHPAVVGSLVHLLAKAGATKIRILEGCFACGDPVEEFMLEAGWDPMPLLNAAPRVEMENTNIAGKPGKYFRVNVPGKGHIFNGFDLNHSYVDCDVFISVAKMKDHATAGVTLTIKNCFGNIPITIYGDKAGVDEPALVPYGGRGPMHYGSRGPSKSAPQENDPKSPREEGYRIPRIISDVVAARPVHIAIIDGIRSMAGGEGPWNGPFIRPVQPGVLVAGLNPVCTDAVGMALMGYDPMAERGKAPFETCDSTLRLSEELGVGTRDLSRIEVIGVPIKDAVYPYRKPKKT
jgi:uncharacterized protein (DUF362 family)